MSKTLKNCILEEGIKGKFFKHNYKKNRFFVYEVLDIRLQKLIGEPILKIKYKETQNMKGINTLYLRDHLDDEVYESLQHCLSKKQ